MVAIATVPVYTTWVAATIVTAAQLNGQIRDAGNFWLVRPYCNVYNNAGLATTSGTLTLVPFDTELDDTDSMHSTVTNSSRIIAQTIGVYRLALSVDWPNNATGERRIMLRLNSGGSSGGGTFICIRDTAATNFAGTWTGPELNIPYRTANIGDYWEMFIQQNSGGALTSPGGSYALTFTAMWESS